jgi:type II secretory pathway component PulF
MILIGPVMRSAWCGQWCEGVRLGVEAGRPLAEAMQLAADATGSITTMHDARMLAAAHERGESMSSVTGLKVLSPAICLAIDLAISRNDLAPALACLRDMHHQQTRHRIAQMQTALRPVLIILVGVIIALVIAGLLVPFNVLVDSAGTVTL